MGRIILVRHGETLANRLRYFAESDDIPLTERGIEQAHELARRVARDFKPSALYSSAFYRARQTAEIIGAELALTPAVLPDIHERNFGCLRGQAYDRMGELMLSDPAYEAARPWLWAPVGGESLDDVRARAVGALERLGDGESVVVCHGAAIQAVCAHISGEWRESFVPPNCGFVVIGKGAGGWEQPVMSDAWEDLAIAG